MNIQIVQAIHFATIKHKNQIRRDTGYPYITHPLNVLSNLIEVGITDTDIWMAAILHDTLEDTDTTFDELQDTFGLNVANLVLEVTNDKTQPKEVQKQVQLENTPTKSLGARLIKMADKIDNVRDFIENCSNRQRIENYISHSSKLMYAIQDTNKYLFHKFQETISQYVY